MEFLEGSVFTRLLPEYLDDEAYRDLQSVLAQNPLLRDVMPGCGGFRKLRWADTRRRKGRRGGIRIIYYYFLKADQIWFMSIYDKNEAADLSPGQKKALRAAIDSELLTRRSRTSSR
jgi:hypothetical protein